MNIILAILIFSLVVIIHEFGHYIFARIGGITVNEFSLGMGPRLFSFDAYGTKWSVKLLPIGGSCMMEGEDAESNSEGAFGNKPVITRILTVFGGPLFNFILAFILSVIVIASSGYDISEVSSVIKGYPADISGIRKGDIITKINGKNITLGREVTSYFIFNPLSNKNLRVTVKRGDEVLDFNVLPQEKEKFVLGIKYSNNDALARVEGLSEDSPLRVAGVTVGDTITSINGIKIDTGSSLFNYIEKYPFDGEPINIDLIQEDTNTSYSVEVLPKSVGSSYTIGLASNVERRKANFFQSIYYGLNETKYMIVSTLESLKLLVTGAVKPKDIAGPVGIVSMIGDSYEQSKSAGLAVILLNLAGISIMISANLGIMNLLPIPALDGGRLVFLFIELIRGKPIDQDKEGMVHFAGFVLLMILMVLILFNDILRIIV